MFADTVWYQEPIVVVAGFALVTELLRRRFQTRDQHRAWIQKQADEKARLLEKADDEAARIRKENRDNARQDLLMERAQQVVDLASITTGEVKLVSRKTDQLVTAAGQQAEVLQAKQDTLTSIGQETNDITHGMQDQLTSVEELGKVTHALVNSDKTALMRETKTQREITLALLNEIIGLRKASQQDLSAETTKAVEALKAEIEIMGANIDDRVRQQEAQEAANKAAAKIATTNQGTPSTPQSTSPSAPLSPPTTTER